MVKEQVCKNYLKDNDTLLFEIYVFGELSRAQFIPITLINFLASFLANGCISGILERNYIIGMGMSNIYILDLGIHLLKSKNIKPQEVQILDMKSINNVFVKSYNFDMMHKLTIQTQEIKQLFYVNYNEISKSQLESLSKLTNNL